MIQIRQKIGSVAPEVLTGKGVVKVNSYKEEFAKGAIDFKFDAGIYGHAKVKRQLIEFQNGKCCFCETRLTAVSYGDVEHYRPKAGWVQQDEHINKPGYYWLAYEWDNLLFSCQVCNQQFKKNYFPLQTETTRARSHNDDVGLEDALFIHPVNDRPEEHIEFEDEIPRQVNGSARGTATIERTGLKREALNEKRRVVFKNVRHIYKLAKGYPQEPADLKQEAVAIIKEYYDAAQQDSTEYASMLRCFFRKNPIDF